MKKKNVILALKIAVLLAVLALIGWQLYVAWHNVEEKHLPIAWVYLPLGLLGFGISMVTSGLVWRFLAWKMEDRSPTLPLLGAYTFSQMGKYIPGKVVLLLMRIERSGRFGMKAGVCTLATLLENALYMVSGGLVGMGAIIRVSAELKPEQRPLVWPVTIAGVLVLAAACHPAVFYALVNRILKSMKKPVVVPEQRLKARTLVLAVILFVPCWLAGGLALWASARSVYPDLPLEGCEWFAGAYALSVILGMASPMPGGLGIREAVLWAAVAFQLGPLAGHSKAALLATVAVVLQRLFQVIVEVLLGISGAALTGVRQRAGGKAEAEGQKLEAGSRKPEAGI